MFFGIGFPELFTIALIGLIIFGPNRLPQAARGVAKGIRTAREYLAKAMDSLDEEARGITDFASELKSFTPRSIVSQVLAPEVSPVAPTSAVSLAQNSVSAKFDPDAT